MSFLLLLFLFLFGIYGAGQSGVIPSYRDAGDFIASIFQLGIPHPPGYPLYVLVGKISLIVLPWANVAYRLHILSAFCAALTAVVCLRAADRWQVSRPAALLSVLLWALSPAVIALARVDEMYTLAALFTALLLWAVSVPDSRQKIPLVFYTLGLSVAAHATLILLTPLAILCLKRSTGLRACIVALVLSLVGLSLYLYLPVRAWQQPLSNWGDPGHWRNFWRVVTRADYGGLRLHPVQSQFEWTLHGILLQLFYFFKSFGTEWRWVGLGLGGWGIIAPTAAANKRLYLGALLTWLLVGPCFFILSNLSWTETTTSAILQPYLLVAGIAWMPLVAFGISNLQQRLRTTLSSAGVVLLTVCVAVGGILTAIQLSHRYDFFAYDYGRNLMRSLPPNSVLYDPDDPTAFTIRALQATENRRTDILTLNFFRTRWGYEQLRRQAPDLLPAGDVPNAQFLESLFWSYSIHRRPFFVELPQKLQGHPSSAEGLVYSIGVTSSSETFHIAKNNFDRYVVRRDPRAEVSADFFTRHLIDYYAAGHTNLGLELSAAMVDKDAVDEYKAALVIDPKMAVAYNNWGVLEFNHHRYREASALYRRAVAFDPENTGFRKNLELSDRSF